MKTIYLIFVFLILSIYLTATLINVPADQPTIQAGINAAANSDTVLVQPGTYVENIDYNGKQITICSLFLTTRDTSYVSQTIIDGNDNGSVVKMVNVNGDAILSGFTLIHGSGDEHLGTNSGGGIFMEGSTAEFEYLIIKNNYAEQAGTIFCWESDPVFDKLLICNNTSENTAIGISFNSNSVFSNCTIVNNIANDSFGGIACTYNCNLSLINSIVWSNDDYQIGFSEEYGNCTVSISYSDIEGGIEGIETFNSNTLYWLEGNIDDYPLFVNSINGDYHLTENSPCIDAGDPDSPLDPDGTIADMGAFYYNQGNAIDDNEIPVSEFKLSNHPNPFNPTTSISFDIKENETGTLTLFNIKGQMIESQQFESGKHNYLWDAANQTSGIYLYKLQTQTINETKKMLLLK